MPCGDGLVRSRVRFPLCLWDYHSYGGFRVKAGLRNGDIVVSGDNWPIFLYKDYKYDSEDVWNGLLRSNILVSVS